jgi:hypothetical protein
MPNAGRPERQGNDERASGPAAQQEISLDRQAGEMDDRLVDSTPSFCILRDCPMPNLVATKFFLAVYGFQTKPNFLRTAHTFATMTRKVYCDDGSSHEEAPLIISWLPRSGTIHAVGAEPGRIYTLPETLAMAQKLGAKVCRTVPTEVTAAFYDSFSARIGKLNSGDVEYIMIDRFATRPDDETNCIHALSDLPIVLDKLPMLDTGFLHGISASFAVYNYFQPWFAASVWPEFHVTTSACEWPDDIEVLDENKAASLHTEYAQENDAIGKLLKALHTLTRPGK